MLGVARVNSVRAPGVLGCPHSPALKMVSGGGRITDGIICVVCAVSFAASFVQYYPRLRLCNVIRGFISHIYKS